MLRYLRATQMMKKIIEENNLTVIATIARYAAAYEAMAKLDWWNKAKRCASVSPVHLVPGYLHVYLLQCWPDYRASNPLLRPLPLLRR